jgi:acyl dehydratase
LSRLRDQVGRELGPTEWLEVTQERVNLFAEATKDGQWIHVDPERAARESPFGTTVAHGFLTLALTASFVDELLPMPECALTVNYGVNRVRFPAPLPVGSRIRGRLRVEQVEEVPGGEQLVATMTVERAGWEKPVCVAELVFRCVR